MRFYGPITGPVSDALDDGIYEFKVLSQDTVCKVRLEGPADPQTGLQYSRDISLGTDSPEVSFHAVMKNATGHPTRYLDVNYRSSSSFVFDTATSGLLFGLTINLK